MPSAKLKHGLNDREFRQKVWFTVWTALKQANA